MVALHDRICKFFRCVSGNVKGGYVLQSNESSEITPLTRQSAFWEFQSVERVDKSSDDDTYVCLHACPQITMIGSTGVR